MLCHVLFWLRSIFVHDVLVVAIITTFVKFVDIDKYKMLHWLKAVKNVKIPTLLLLTSALFGNNEI